MRRICTSYKPCFFASFNQCLNKNGCLQFPALLLGDQDADVEAHLALNSMEWRSYVFKSRSSANTKQTNFYFFHMIIICCIVVLFYCSFFYFFMFYFTDFFGFFLIFHDHCHILLLSLFCYNFFYSVHSYLVFYFFVLLPNSTRPTGSPAAGPSAADRLRLAQAQVAALVRARDDVDALLHAAARPPPPPPEAPTPTPALTPESLRPPTPAPAVPANLSGVAAALQYHPQPWMAAACWGESRLFVRYVSPWG